MSKERKYIFLLIAGLGMSAAIGFLLPDLGPRGVALLIVPAIGYFLLTSETLGLYLLVASFPVENVVTIGGSLTATRLLGVVVAGLWIWRKLALRQSPAVLVSHKLVKVAILVLLSALATTLWATHIAPTVIGVISLAQLIFLTVLVIDLIVTWDRAATLLSVVVATGVLGALITLEQYYVGGARRAGDDVAGGVNGTAATLVSIMPFAFYLMRSQEQRFLRLLGAAYIVLGTMAVAVTFSRSSYILLGLLVAMQCWHGLRSRSTRKWFVLLILVGVVAASFAPQHLIVDRVAAIGPALVGVTEGFGGKSTDSRAFHWAVGLAVFADNPVLGAGYNNYGAEFGRYQFRLDTATRYWVGRRGAHSSYIACLADQGLVGMFLWLLLIVVAGANILSALRNLSRGGETARLLLVQAVTYSFALQIFYAGVLEVRQNKFFWLLLGLSVALNLLVKRESPRQIAPNDEHSSPGRSPDYDHTVGRPRWAT